MVGLVTGSSFGREKAAAWGVPAFDTIQDLVERTGAQVVDVCTPTYRHKDHVTQALEAGAHVIVEKPCALFQRLSARPDWAQGGWLFDRQKSGLVPFDLHIHDLDVIASLFGVPEETECRCCKGGEGSFPELYRWEYRCGGVNVAAEAGWLSASIPFTAVWRVYFERGAVIYDGEHVTAYPYGGEMVVFDTEEKVKIPTGINVPPTGWYLRELGHFLDCVRRDEDSGLVPKERVLAVLELLEQNM